METTPEFFQGGYQFTPEKRHSDTKSASTADHFIVEDLLDFPSDDVVIVANGGTFDNVTVTSTDSSTITVIDSCNSFISSYEPHFSGDLGCRSFANAQFSNDLCVPYDDLAELEWLSNFVEESFSTEDLQKLQIISGMKARTDDEAAREFQPEPNRANPIFCPEVSVPGKARSKRSRAAPGNWTSRLSVLSPTTKASPTSSELDIASSSGKKTVKVPMKKKEGGDHEAAGSGGDGRRCLHCATDKTPQWRTGPLGPKTLCNACGVRYKSGRLVPEYRPAASPTFMLTKHSNSHRKVLELRRQKELQRAHQQQQQFLHQSMRFDVSNGDDYLIHQHIGPDFRHLI
ncbi:GATA transcription factor 12 [Camellia lanceoleosa]|uniref:GATA transcription factor 12 n=1 Tax=Camellia lanceoleosa TaxID=1840588 RepID=A0ACC0FMX3_9ERIC|nr:GATA transcription factor 12 [Camellia lanceoleosa]